MKSLVEIFKANWPTVDILLIACITALNAMLSFAAVWTTRDWKTKTSTIPKFVRAVMLVPPLGIIIVYTAAIFMMFKKLGVELKKYFA